MPELPEAETLVRGLRPLLPGRRITDVEIRHADVLRVPAEAFRTGVLHRTIERVGRRAKNVVVELSGPPGRDARGDGVSVLVVNLGMTGALVPLGFAGVPEGRATHPALIFDLDDGSTLVYDDVRRFGCVEVMDAGAWRSRSRAMGPEPLSPSFRARNLHQALLSSRTPLRNWLLDQRRIAGVGNIYANEACFRARVHPARPARQVTWEEARRLHRGLRQVLRAAVALGGTTLRDYRNARGEPGKNQGRLLVYGREGAPCPRCATPIERVVFGNRSAFLCPRCQC